MVVHTAPLRVRLYGPPGSVNFTHGIGKGKATSPVFVVCCGHPLANFTDRPGASVQDLEPQFGRPGVSSNSRRPLHAHPASKVSRHPSRARRRTTWVPTLGVHLPRPSQLENSNCFHQLLPLILQAFSGSGTFLYQGSILLRDLIHLTDCIAHLLDA
jgi:hypothetical protein